MAIQFGVNRLRAYTNGIGSGCVAAGGTGSATVGAGSVWIGGIECVVTGSSMDIDSGASANTGNMCLYAYLPAGNSSTANVSFATGSSVIYLNRKNPGTAIAILSVGQFGTGSSSYATAASCSLSGLTGARPFGRAQNCNITISYDNAMHRGGTLIFPNDQKLYNGSVEGTLEHANISGANLASIFGADWTSGGAGSGTMTLTATQQPIPFMVEAQ